MPHLVFDLRSTVLLPSPSYAPVALRGLRLHGGATHEFSTRLLVGKADRRTDLNRLRYPLSWSFVIHTLDHSLFTRLIGTGESRPGEGFLSHGIFYRARYSLT